MRGTTQGHIERKPFRSTIQSQHWDIVQTCSNSTHSARRSRFCRSLKRISILSVGGRHYYFVSVYVG